MQSRTCLLFGAWSLLYMAGALQIVGDRFSARRETMVATQIEQRGVDSKSVLDSMKKVPRHLFVPPKYQEQAYDDHPLPIGLGQTISQPYIVALMTEIASPDPDDVVLEVGTGSGYQAAILAQIVRRVYTVELFQQLADEAQQRFKVLGYTNISLKSGDGYYGWEEHAPFDAIVVTAAAEHIPPPLIRQLKPGGIMIIPVGNRFQVQTLVLVEKDTDGKTRSRNLLPVRFVPLLGKH